MMMNDIGPGIFFQNVYYKNKIQTYYILLYWNFFISNSYLRVILYRDFLRFFIVILFFQCLIKSLIEVKKWSNFKECIIHKNNALKVKG